jgi:hypothetical protein
MNIINWIVARIPVIIFLSVYTWMMILLGKLLAKSDILTLTNF